VELLVANENVLEDQVVDTLAGGQGFDLFFAAVDTPSNNDVLTDFDSLQEQVEVMHPPIPASQLVGEPLGALYTFNDSSIDLVRIAVPPALWFGATPSAVTVEITLIELRGDNTVVHLQTRSLLLSAATPVSPNGGPGGTALFDIDTTTDELNAGSRLEVTTTLRGPGVLDGVAARFTMAIILDPVRPF
jgi:hypothetical protein